MKIELKCFATLDIYQPKEPKSYETKDGQTISQLMKELGIPENAVKIALINGRHSEFDAEVKDGDRVGLFPAVGGG